MNTFKVNFSGFGFFHRKVIQEKLFFLRYLPSVHVYSMAAMILLPCFIEAAFAEPVKVIAESGNSYTMGSKISDENVSHVLSSDRAFKISNNGNKSTPEISIISSLPNFPPVPVEEVSSNAGKNQSGYKILNTQITLHDAFNVLVLFFVTSFPLLYGVFFPEEVQRLFSKKKENITT